MTAGPGELQEPPAPSRNAREGQHQDRGDEQHWGLWKGMGEAPVQSLISIKIGILGVALLEHRNSILIMNSECPLN